MKKRTYGYKNIKSESGILTVHIAQNVTNRLSRFCKMQNKSRKSVVEQAVIEYLETRENEAVRNMTREELEQLVLKGWKQ